MSMKLMSALAAAAGNILLPKAVRTEATNEWQRLNKAGRTNPVGYRQMYGG